MYLFVGFGLAVVLRNWLFGWEGGIDGMDIPEQGEADVDQDIGSAARDEGDAHGRDWNDGQQSYL